MYYLMNPILGWTMLKRDDVRQAERALANSEQETRDEIGFLLIHQGLADRFFPGTSVLHTRIRYVLFIPWAYKRAASVQRRGRDLDARIRDMLIELAYRLKVLGQEPYGVIGGDKLGQLTSQPPDRSYWSALRAWGILLSDVESRTDALRRLQSATVIAHRDDDGGRLDDTPTEAFSGLPRAPDGWDDRERPLKFKLPNPEREFLRNKLCQLSRADGAPALLARLVESKQAIEDNSFALPLILDRYADAADKEALGVARDAAALSAIGRAVYGALVEELIAIDGGKDDRTFRELLKPHFASYGEAAGRCNLDTAEKLLPDLPDHVKTVLRKTQAYVLRQRPEGFSDLLECYRDAEQKRKGPRARLSNTERAAIRRCDWVPARHNISPIHYRWRVVRDMIEDLSE
jgi:hypothetical protein